MQESSWNKIQYPSGITPPKRWGQASCLIDSKIVIFGGFSEEIYQNDVWAFDSLTLQWEEVIAVGQIPHQRSHSTLNLHNNGNDLVLFGGGSKNKQRFNSVHFLNWKTKEWTLVEINQNDNRPEERTYHTANVIGSYLVVFGGEGVGDFGDLWLFDLQTHKWTQINTQDQDIKPQSRRFHASCQRKNQLIIIGGCKDKYKMTSNIYTLNFDKYLTTKNPHHLAWISVQTTSNDYLLERWGQSASYNPINDKVYVFGGRTSTGDINSLIEITIDGWQAILVNVQTTNRPVPRRKHSANFVGNSLVVFGGFDSKYYNDLHSIEIQDRDETQVDKVLDDAVSHIKLKYGQDQGFIYAESLSNTSVSKDAHEFDQTGLKQLFSQISLSKNLTLTEKCSQVLVNSGEIHIKHIETQQILVKDTNVQGIAILGDQEYENYIKDNISINKSDKCNPEQQQCTYNIFSQLKGINEEGIKSKKIQIDVEGQYSFLVDTIIRTKSRYFENCFTEGNKINVTMIKDLKDMKILQACIVSIKQGVLVVSDKFTLTDWTKLLQLTDYFCAQSLSNRIQKLLTQQCTLLTISHLIPLTPNLPQLSTKCCQLIISSHFQKFLSQNTNIKYRQMTDKLTEFQIQMLVEISDQSRYPRRFCENMIRYLRDHRFGMMVRFMDWVRESRKKQKDNNGEDMEEQDW